MGEFAQQLLAEHPKEASRAFVPLVALFDELIDAATDAGCIRAGISRDHFAGVALQAIMFNTFAATISHTSLRADEADAEALWELLLLGIGT
jgi:hypothetical protein